MKKNKNKKRVKKLPWDHIENFNCTEFQWKVNQEITIKHKH